MSNQKTVAIIGGGPSGLTTAKWALQTGLLPTLFEKCSDIGGVWRVSSQSTWAEMRTNATKFFLSFSDHPWPESQEFYPTVQQMNDYLKSYVAKFGFEKNIVLNSKVERVEQLNNERWLVIWQDLICGEKKEEIYDFLVLSSGSFSTGFIPNISGIDKFKGKIVHSTNYNGFRKEDDIANKRIIVVGHSISGAELSADLARQNAKVLNLIKRPHWILKKNLKMNPERPDLEIPNDFILFNRKMQYDMKEIKSKSEEYKLKNGMFGTMCAEQNDFPGLYRDPNSDEVALITLCDSYMDHVKAGRIEVKRQCIDSFTENGVILKDGCFIEADIVVFCTGHHLTLDFMDERVLQKMEHDVNDSYQPIILYKTTIHPDIKNFAAVGMLKMPSFMLTETQARWVSRLFNGTLSPPDKAKMIKGLETERNFRHMFDLRPQFPHLETLVIFTDEVAEELNAVPDLEKLSKEEPEIYKAIPSGPLCAFHYNLSNENIETARLVARQINSYLEYFRY